MQVEVQMIGLLDGGRLEGSKRPPQRVQLPEGATIQDLVANLEVEEAEVEAIELNGRPEVGVALLHDGDSVLLKGEPYGGM